MFTFFSPGLRLRRLALALLAIGVASGAAHARDDADAAADPFVWHERLRAPAVAVPAGVVIAQVDDALLIIGGVDAANNRMSGAVDIYDRARQAWETHGDLLPQPLAFAATTVVGAECFVVGGRNDRGALQGAFSISRSEGKWVRRDLPPLPDPRSHGSLTHFRGALYFLGGRGSDGSPQANLWKLELAPPSAAARWVELAPLPANAGGTALVPQYWGDGYALYALPSAGQGSGMRGAVWEFRIATGAWLSRAEMPAPAFAQPVAVRVGIHHVLVGESGLSARAWLFHTVTGTWREVGAPPGSTGTIAATELGTTPGLVVRADDGALAVVEARPREAGAHLAVLDYAVIATYFAGMMLIGAAAARRRGNSDDYFRAGRRLPGWAAGVSLVATQLSAISYLSLPAKTFTTDWLYITGQISMILGSLLCIWTIVPQLYRLNITSAYEFLERRYNVSLRLFASALFCIFQIIRMGALILLPSAMVSLITEIDIFVCIVLIGLVATVYTYAGGLEAVVWTDVVQTVVMIAGMLIIIGVMIYALGGDMMAIAATAWEAGKLRMVNTGADFTAPSLLLILLYVPLFPGEFASNQNVVQRIVSTRNLREARRVMILNAIVAPSLVLLLFVIGTLLFYFYREFPERLNPAMNQSDEILAWFIVKELPVGLPGLLIAAIFAATMSSLDSGLSGVSTVVVRDFVGRYRKDFSDRSRLRLAQKLVLGLGLLGTGTAAIYATLDIQSLFDHFSSIFVLLLGTLGGVFSLGLWTQRVRSGAAICGMLAGAAAMYVASSRGLVHFFHFSLIGVGTSMLVAYCLSWLPGRAPPAAQPAPLQRALFEDSAP